MVPEEAVTPPETSVNPNVGKKHLLTSCLVHLQGYMMKKGHKRKNWTERWFLLKPNLISYYVHEDLAEHKGDILLDGNCIVEVSTGWPGSFTKPNHFLILKGFNYQAC